MANEELFQSSRRDEPPKRFFLEGRNPETGLWRLVDASGTVRVEAQGMFDLQPPIGEEVGYVPGPIPTAIWHQRRPFEKPSFEEETLQPALFFVYGLKTPEFYEIRSFAPNTNKNFVLARLDRYVTETEIYVDGVKNTNTTSFSQSASSGPGSPADEDFSFVLSNVDTQLSTSYSGAQSGAANAGISVNASSDGLLDEATALFLRGLNRDPDEPGFLTGGGYLGSYQTGNVPLSPLGCTIPFNTRCSRYRAGAVGGTPGSGDSGAVGATHTIVPLITTNPVLPVHFETDGKYFYISVVHQPRVVWTGERSGAFGFRWLDPFDQPYLRGTYFEYFTINLDGSLKRRRTFTYPEPIVLDSGDPMKGQIELAYQRYPYAFPTTSIDSLVNNATFGFNPYIDLGEEVYQRLYTGQASVSRYGYTQFNGVFYALGNGSQLKFEHEFFFSIEGQKHEFLRSDYPPGTRLSLFPNSSRDIINPLKTGDSVQITSDNIFYRFLDRPINVRSAIAAYRVYGFAYLPQDR